MRRASSCSSCRCCIWRRSCWMRCALSTATAIWPAKAFRISICARGKASTSWCDAPNTPDVSGKGMPAALLMSAARGIVRSLAPLASGPGEVLARVNQMLLDDFPTGRYVTMIYAVLDPARRTLTFASAGHPWPLLCHGTDVRPLHTDAGMPLGLLPSEFTEHTVKLCRDFRLLFYTDAISEALNREDQEFGSARLTEFVVAHDCSISRLMEAIKEFRGKCLQKDDATLILLRSV